ncbi:MAG: phosphate ABC transporter substrate-binding protein PstS [Bacteroidetes bacterium CG2_30_33_31]|nr:MAG: phosphate ABC transporter substrate-binding protein PstS [Bacteroidetes bacterium CG2_30_33_31]
MKNFLAIILLAVIITSCNNGNSDNKSEAKDSKVSSITAAGATFPLPFYNIAFENYTKKTDILVTYGGIGSGGGIRSLKDKVVDFGATDAFLDAKQEAEMPAQILHIPTCIGAVVIAFNLTGITDLKLSNENLSDIFMGKITKWNDAKLVASNPGTKLPNVNITLVHRSDGSGTTYIFSDYMSKISKVWESTLGRGKSINWTVGMGAKGNPGVAGTIQQTVGTIGYIGSEFAFAQKISYAKIQNSAGNFIEPNLASISAAAQGDIPADTKVMLTNSSDAKAYPISGFTWLILYKEQNYNGRSKAQAEETVKVLSWMIEKDAQTLAEEVNYAKLPAMAVTKAKEILKTVVYDGTPLIK